MIAGVMAIERFPYWKHTVQELMKHCDKVYVRFDGHNGDPLILNQLKAVCGDKFGKCLLTQGWSVPEWREDCLRMLDNDKPTVVLCPDQDEIFADGFADELKAFIVSEKKAMMFTYAPLETCDKRVVNEGVPYPVEPHMKAFKWEEGLSYYPYHGNAKISRYFNSDCHWTAQTKIRHLCCYTPAMEARKRFRNDVKGKKKAVKAVTLLGFGPSSKGEIQVQGEVWSLNNCYDAIPKKAMKLCTRIFEMHDPAKRKGKKDVGRDGKPHWWHLDEEGKKGRRIIMQDVDSQITNSEAYQLAQIQAKTGIQRLYTGSPIYMLAMAICEGYTHIRVYGLDQLDREHLLQREGWLFWIGYALGQGIQISGALTAMDRYTKLYGYDYAPEWDDYQEKLFWQGHPNLMDYPLSQVLVDGKLTYRNIPSRASAGDLYAGDR